MHAKHVFTILLLLYITPLVACQCNEWHANSAVTISANKMDANIKTIDSKSAGSEGYTLKALTW